ncbi:hypothetical protein [Microbacterium sp.]|uniref:hypothetical protein n=1 Tax=Microbacterium sp. TaxID=51671 RepID=UPI0027323B1C|nr:hypothetical protein [Microbacterium sp.]MDP3953096.1 hypothetical protein [Microbacterium sp.]
MLSADESAELRELQGKAYGRDGALSPVELARLQELEPARSRNAPSSPIAEPVEASEAVSPSTGSGIDAGSGVGLDPGVGLGAEATESPAAEPVEASGASAGSALRRRWPVIVAASAAILAIGLGTGWGIWGWDARTFALAAAHADQRTEIEASEDFDPGTVIPVAEQHGVVVWRADRSDGDEVCVIVTTASQTQSGCAKREDLGNSAWTNAMITVPEGEEKAGQQLSAALITTPAGELVPIIQVWDQNSSGWESQYSEEELAQLRRIEAAGYQGGSLGIIGYDGDTVVWSSWEPGFCVIAAADDGLVEACADDAQSEIDLTLAVIVDGVPTEYVVHQSEMRGPQLTVIRHPDAVKVEVDPETGDPIEFTFDDPTFDDLVIDGETGTTDETGG